MNKYQIEIRFDDQPPARPASRKPLRPRRAQWWFGQMRRVVDGALDWKPTPPARPQQIYIAFTPGR